MYGVPVAYLPYFSHPDPTVDRKTGLLAPTFGSDSELGKIVRTPYYFNISPDKDATIEPILTTNEGPVLSGEYRERFAHGNAELSGSITDGSTNSGTREARGHIKGMSRFDLDRNWRAGADLYRSTDDTYLRRYGFDSVDQLTSQLYVEGFSGRNYATVRSYAFQGLRVDDDPGLTPVVWPIAQYSYVGEPGRLGQRWTLDASALQLTRSQGTDSRRISFIPGWRLPYTARSGEMVTLFATLQTDFYKFDALNDPRYAASPPTDGTAKRIFPQVGVDWRYPFVRHDPHVSEIIEPVVGFVAAPNGGNPFRIPNEDSLDIELQDANVFNANRFTGTDRVEGGQRAYYGLRASAIGQGGGSSSVFLGQSYRLRKDDTFPVGSGLEDRLSDYVGRVQIRPASFFDTNYRFRIDKDNYQPKRHEVGVSVGPPALRIGLNYIFIEQTPNETAFRTREELQGVVLARLTPTWSAGANMLRNLGENGGELRHGFSLIYEDECFTFSTNFARSFAEDRDVRPSSSLLFRISFKNLGRLQYAD
jgi:LPS-assembly protein